jgi:hypothetical protein
MSESNPEVKPAGCVLFVVQGSEAMTVARLARARLHIDHTIDLLLKKQESLMPGTGKVRIGVIGYTVTAERKRLLVPLLEGTERTSDLVALADLAGEHRQVRIDLLKPGIKARVSEGLLHAYLLLHHWVALHPEGRPPVVVHWGDGRKCDSAHRRVSRSLRLLGSAAGATGLAHVVLDGSHTHFVGEPYEALEGVHRVTWGESSPVALPRPGRAFAMNADPLRIVKALLRQSRPVTVPKTTPVPVAMRAMAMPKRGNSDEEIEDALAIAPEEGRAVISDGASEGIFVNRWARLLTQSFMESRPDVRDTAAYRDWLTERRKAWFAEIDYPKLRWSQQNKVDQTGGAATFLSFEIGKTPEGELCWKAWAVGDSCLFWIRNNRLRATFPMAHSSHFATSPFLLGTRKDLADPAPIFAAARCHEGDRFILATDALSRYFLRMVERRKEPDWKLWEEAKESSWQKRIEFLRDRRKIVNDDCTMIVIRV